MKNLLMTLSFFAATISLMAMDVEMELSSLSLNNKSCTDDKSNVIIDTSKTTITFTAPFAETTGEITPLFFLGFKDHPVFNKAIEQQKRQIKMRCPQQYLVINPKTKEVLVDLMSHHIFTECIKCIEKDKMESWMPHYIFAKILDCNNKRQQCGSHALCYYTISSAIRNNGSEQFKQCYNQARNETIIIMRTAAAIEQLQILQQCYDIKQKEKMNLY